MKPLFLYILLFFTLQLTAQQKVGDYVSHVVSGTSVTIKTTSAVLKYTFYCDDILRVDFLPQGSEKPDSSFTVIQKPNTEINLKLFDSDSKLDIKTNGISVQISKKPFNTVFTNQSSKVLIKDSQSGGFFTNGEKRTAAFSIQQNEHFYGTGERGTGLDKRGQIFESYNSQIGGYATPLSNMNLNVSFMTSSHGYAVLFDNTYRGLFDVGATDSTQFSYTASGGELTYYLIAGKTIPDQLEKYTWLTGRQPLPPRWALGFIQSKNRYETEAETRMIVKTMREKKFPSDGIVIDLAWFKQMGDISWDTEHWPAHEKMVSDFLSIGIKTILITEPYIIEPSVNFRVADSKQFLTADSAGKTFIFPKWWSCDGCNSSLLDLTNPEARKWWWSLHPSFLGHHVAGLWTDLGEPERHDNNMIHFLGSAEKVHNIFNLLWAETIYNGMMEFRPNQRVFNLTRSGFSGIQRYGVLPWSGDVSRSFGGLSVQLPMLLNMGMSGLAYQHSDMGGYARHPTTPELYIRWTQFGVFSPIVRAHGAGESVKGSPTEPWMFGDEAETITRHYIRLRYRLFPYNYSLAYQNYQSGLPLARPLFWLDGDDNKLADESRSYMWGDAFLVSPVTETKQFKKEVYLPKGKWYDFETDQPYDGGKVHVFDTPIEKIPVLVKAGSIIPMASDMMYSDEKPLDTLAIHFYKPESEKTMFTLYEDDGKTLDYQTGKFGLTLFSQQIGKSGENPVLEITIDSTIGRFPGQLMKRVFIVTVHQVDKNPDKITVNGVKLRNLSNQNRAEPQLNAFWYDSAKKTVIIPVETDLNKGVSIILEPNN